MTRRNNRSESSDWILLMPEKSTFHSKACWLVWVERKVFGEPVLDRGSRCWSTDHICRGDEPERGIRILD
jgi:hypothetical protein